ncbi:MAG: lipid-A-disaccharide synthase, partial [Wenzhouxiangella sp.]
MTARPLRVVLTAGETSGDRLGADLAASLQRRQPDIEMAGVAGPAMQAAGVEAWFDLDVLNIMGLTEVIRHLPRLIRLRRELFERITAWQPDVFVGIDAPDFHLGLARRLRKSGLRTVQYVSPTVWAWRAGRAAGVARSVDLLLTLFPFESDHYAGLDLETRFVGHPLADRIPQRPSRSAARAALGIGEDETLVALLPGSRSGEIRRHAGLLVESARLIGEQRPGIRLAAFCVDATQVEQMREVTGDAIERAGIEMHSGQTSNGLAGADCAMIASGTATLEGFLLECPMTVFYRLAPATYALLRQLRLVRSRHIALPNIVSGRELVPEFVQGQATPGNLAAATLAWLDAYAAGVNAWLE